MFAVCLLLFSVLKARMPASRKKLGGNSDMGDRDENTYSDNENDELLKNFRQKKRVKINKKI